MLNNPLAALLLYLRRERNLLRHLIPTESSSLIYSLMKAHE